ncbi:unnamed protein product [Candida verbasci]|uniref:Manganese/iron superoxide dismutase C-terminal domain-containing protein n=1 Tax=Candida verbasci TaxID=1227364 RepID=A0A9W4TW22_9ASCO|nr:unnamed protein product [Candida verbasci]
MFKNTKILSRRLSTFSLPVNKSLEGIKATGENFQGLFSNKTINQLWFERGENLSSNLNNLLSQTSILKNDKEYSLQTIISLSMNTPELYQLHKYASNLFNLNFFIESLKQNDANKIEKKNVDALLETPKNSFGNIPTDHDFLDWINYSFGSIEEFRNLLINSGRAINGDGIVWVVAESSMSENYLDKNLPQKVPRFTNLAIVNTYNGGVLNDAERSGQISRMKKLLKEETEEDELELGSVEEAEYNVAYHNKSLIPILSIDVSPRNYLLDYGVFGKQKYLENVWECIDWDVVLRRLPERTTQLITM